MNTKNSMPEKIIVTGSGGQLGSELRELAPSFPQYEFIFLTRQEASIEDAGRMEKILAQHKPAWLINCAAYTAVDLAESEKEKASRINGTAVGALAAACKKHRVRLIHISTDYVFDGNATSPLKEDHLVDPLNAYGASKLLGEQLSIQNNPDTIVIRTSWVYSYHGKNFVKTMMRLMREKEQLSVVSDQIGSPTYAADLASDIILIIRSRKWKPGIYHYSNEGIISWFDFAKEIKNLINASCKLLPITTEQFPTPARRPKYSVLDKTKIITDYNVQLKDWKKSLKICVEKLSQN
ncbi:MAG: dTDP-4-dehydrorhamnose reductase [Flavisolibacter sp.]